MIIHIVNEQNSLKISSKQVEKLIHQVLNEENCFCDEVSVTFVDTQRICDLHDEFFQDPSPTDCISFPMDLEEDDPYRVLGEVFVCPDTAIRYAAEHGGDPYEETTLYIVHGLLHLMGYDDIDEQDCMEMRQAETRHMTKISKLELILY